MNTTALAPLGAAPVELQTFVAPDWQQAAGDWRDNLKSDRTRRAYLEAWAAFLTFAQVEPAAVTQSHVIAYRKHLKTAPSPRTGRPYSQSTINQHLSALSSFFAFAQGRGLRADNPAEGVARESVAPYGKATWLNPQDDEDLKLVETVDTTTPQGLRDRAILLLFLTGAFRVEEVADMTVGALRRQGAKVFVTYRRKGGETEEVPLAPEAAEALEVYLKTRPNLSPAAPIFVATAKGREAARHLGRDLAGETALTARAIAYLVKTYCDRAFGPGHGIHPHSLRHTAAQVAISEGRSVTEVSRLLKHKSLAVTTIYLHATASTDYDTAKIMGRRYAGALTGARGLHFTKGA